ncbi:MAG: carbohydrate ABC transporter permease [Pleomorphochaeta sp.]
MKKKIIFHKNTKKIAFLSLFPIFLYHFILVIVPSFNTIISSFTNWNGLRTKDFIGLMNYIELFNSSEFYEAFANNLKWMAIFITIPIAFSIIISYLLTHIKSGMFLFRMLYFLPYVISAAIAGKIFAAYYNPFFGINSWFDSIGLSALSIDWLAPKNALYSVAFVDMWHWWGFLLVIFLSALQQIDSMLYESAEIEGASEIQKLYYITIPSIKPTLIFIILISMVWSISTFDYVWVMTKGSVGSSILSTLMYKNSLLKYRAGYGCAISVIQGLLAFLIFFGFGKIQKKFED